MDVRLVRTAAGDLDSSWIGHRLIVGERLGVLSDIGREGRSVVLYLGGERVVVNPKALCVYDTLGSGDRV